MASAVDDFEFDRGFHAAIRAVQFVRLIDRHLRILVSMKQEQGRIVAIDMKDRARQPREFDNVGGLPAEQ